jgi:hypothetical protein
MKSPHSSIDVEFDHSFKHILAGFLSICCYDAVLRLQAYEVIIERISRNPSSVNRIRVWLLTTSTIILLVRSCRVNEDTLSTPSSDYAKNAMLFSI